ncbi:hypothetical protein ACHHYP_04186 [Achlya hypogyna]|uniref:C2 domain-containing protein n=1 Tax=Achlya hypogyna TaxID=1202772 RepID=A0A1V9Z1Q1_ACHHY|nr:hypothetical protein ACHHYP_04186 [Achlya hypogyna]
MEWADSGVVEAAKTIQRMYRCHAARKLMLSIASTVYRKCFDEASGLYYYCNLRTGDTAWDRPHVFTSSQDAPVFMESSGSPEQDDADALPVERPKTVKARREELQALRQEGIRLVQQRAEAKAQLERASRKKVHQGRKAWEKRCLQQQEEARMERRRQIAAENKQLVQDLLDGTYKPQLGSIRDACMRGDLARVADLLNQGFSANAESAMGLTPLLAACGNGHLPVVQLLLDHGAHVDHRHVITHRTPYMEACQRANVAILRQLLRAGAHLHWQDKQGRTAFDGIADNKILTMHSLAAEVWTPATHELFPTPFRVAGLALAFVAKCQRKASSLAQKNAAQSAARRKLELQKRLVETKVRYDTDMRACQNQVVLVRRRKLIDAADASYDAARAALLVEAEDAVLSLRRQSQPRSLSEANIFTILAYCDRHWFDTKPPLGCPPRVYHPPPPTKLRQSSSVLSTKLGDDLAASMASIDAICAEITEVETSQVLDPTSGVSCSKATGASQASVVVAIIDARNLPRRPNRQLIDPFVRARILDERGQVVAPFQATEPRFDDEWPCWEHSLRFPVSSVRCDIHLQVVDHAGGRPELAGEVRLPLRRFLDQKEHDDWYVLPPTLKQQLLEGSVARAVPAEVHVAVTFTHDRALVLHRLLQRRMKERRALIDTMRTYIHGHLQTQLSHLTSI